MAIITISRGSYSKGKEVAEKVAEKLGYQCVGRELFLDAAKEFNIPEVRLVRAIHDAPRILERFTYGKERYIAFFQSAFLKFMRRDNVVYHGLAGHFFLKNVSHTLKVRIIAAMKDRVELEMKRENIGPEAAQQLLKKDDLERRQWSRSLYGIDPGDPNLYDLVIHIKKIKVPEAVEIICQTVHMDSFKTTYESQKAMENLTVAAEVKAALIDLKPDIQVFAENGKVVLGTRKLLIQDRDMATEIETIAKKIPGVNEVEIKATHLVDWVD
jgi:cytidylate kinase